VRTATPQPAAISATASATMAAYVPPATETMAPAGRQATTPVATPPPPPETSPRSFALPLVWLLAGLVLLGVSLRVLAKRR
jgi:hypothetical protein